MNKFILHHKIYGSGPVVVLLPGMLGTTSFWEPLTKILEKNYTVVSFDPLGFGHSPTPKNLDYTLEDHTKALSDSLDLLDIKKPIILVGHSMGAIIAVNFAVKYPNKISKLILVAPAIFKNPKEAKANIAQHSSLPKILLYGPLAYVACHIFCKFLRPITKIGVVWAFRDMPKQVAEDTLLHTWHSYSKTLKNVIENQDLFSDIRKILTPTVVLYGLNDSRVIEKNIKLLKKYNSRVKLIPLKNAGHQFPIYQPSLVAKYINYELILRAKREV